MMEFHDIRPEVAVAEAEFRRLLGYPPDYEPGARALELSAWARQWYDENGRPWMYARELSAVEHSGGALRCEGVSFHGERLVRSFQEAEAHGAVLAAVSAGPEAEQQAQRLWAEEKPDEYFFLETYASAVTEHLVTMLGARLCGWAERQGSAVLPHYSPGYTGWDIAEQPRLRALAGELPGPLETLESGALRPKKSLLAIFGVTGDSASLYRLTAGVPCTRCSFQPCQFRRAPYGRANPPEPQPQYSVNPRALEKWAGQRLRLCRSGDDVVAHFRYDGTTCTNTGLPLAFEYTVWLGPRKEGFPVRQQKCAPAAGDTGHRAMCQYQVDAEGLMQSLEREKPMLGRKLAEVLEWRRPSSPAGCYCDAASRDHKWGLVLETIHYALQKRGDL